MTTIAEGDRLLSTEEAADLLGVPAGTVRFWIVTGYGPPSVKIGRWRKYLRADVLAWLDEQRAATVEDQRRRQQGAGA